MSKQTPLVVISLLVLVIGGLATATYALPAANASSQKLGQMIGDASAQPAQNLSQPRLHAPLMLIAGSASIALATTHTSTPMRVPNISEPPRDICAVIEQLTGKKCAVEVNELVAKSAGGMTTIQVLLRSGDQVIVELQTAQMRLAEILPSKLSQFAGQTTAWVSTIKVVDWAEKSGLGKWAWQAGDKAIAFYTGRPSLSAFVDVAGWGEKLMQEVRPVVQEPRHWIYWIRP